MENIEIAKKYFDLANKGNLESIEEMFTDSSTYSSQNTGVFLGKTSIMKMMEPFFSSFNSLRWDVLNVEEISDGVILFDFILNGEKNTGETVSIKGIEYVIIFNQKIQHIDVRNK